MRLNSFADNGVILLTAITTRVCTSQSNLCLISRIRYDFVGRLENTISDVGYILSHILTPEERSSSLFLNMVTTAFDMGHAVHSTSAIKHLDMFDQVSMLVNFCLAASAFTWHLSVASALLSGFI